MILDKPGNKAVDRTSHHTAPGHQNETAPDPAAQSAAQDEACSRRRSQGSKRLAMDLTITPYKPFRHCLFGGPGR